MWALQRKRRPAEPACGDATMRELKRHLFGVASMVLGGSTALASVFAMNTFAPAPPAEEKTQSAEFKVEKQKPPPKQRPKPQKRREVKTTSAARAPAPNLASVIGGVDFALPGFASADFGGVSDKLLGDTSKHTTMTAESVDTKPQPRHRAEPEYPAKARQRGIKGHVVVRVKVNADGRAGSARVVEAKPPGVFEESALAAVKQWEFSPGIYQGSPVDVWVNLPIRFELQ